MKGIIDLLSKLRETTLLQKFMIFQKEKEDNKVNL